MSLIVIGRDVEPRENAKPILNEFEIWLDQPFIWGVSPLPFRQVCELNFHGNGATTINNCGDIVPTFKNKKHYKRDSSCYNFDQE